MIVPAVAQAPVLHKQALKRMHKFSPRDYAHKILLDKGLGLSAYKCLVDLWNSESHWNPKAKNPNSTAFGIGQLLIETSRDPATQIRNGIRYIEYRYSNSPCNALAFHQKNGWY